jgi:cytochrome c-type biogenesis protein CcmH
MIRTMVAGLAEKLRENPSDLQGWRRLIRSYTVLGENGKAREAIATARVNLASNEDFMREFTDIENKLGTSEGGNQ